MAAPTIQCFYHRWTTSSEYINFYGGRRRAAWAAAAAAGVLVDGRCRLWALPALADPEAWTSYPDYQLTDSSF